MDNRPVVSEKQAEECKPRDRIKPPVHWDHPDPLAG